MKSRGGLSTFWIEHLKGDFRRRLSSVPTRPSGGEPDAADETRAAQHDLWRLLLPRPAGERTANTSGEQILLLRRRDNAVRLNRFARFKPLLHATSHAAGLGN